MIKLQTIRMNEESQTQIIWFDLYEAQEQAKLIYSYRSQKVVDLWWGVGGEWGRKLKWGMKELSGSGYIDVYTHQNSSH